MTESEILTYLTTAIQYGKTDAVQVAQCIGGALPCCLNWSGRKVEDQLILGGLEYNSAGTLLTKITATRTVLNNYNENHPTFVSRSGLTSASDREDLVLDWETTLIDYFDPLYKAEATTDFGAGQVYANSRLYYYTDRSTEDVVSLGSSVDSVLLIISYILCFGYALWSLGRYSPPCSINNFVYSRTLLAMYGLLIVGLSTVAGFGLVSWSESESGA